MEEQKKEELELTETGEKTSGNNGNIPAGAPRRSLILWLLAGGYLVYTGYRLCKNVIDGVEGGGIGFMLAGIAFAVIGAVLVFFGAKGLLNEDKRRKAEEAAAAAQAEEPEEGVEEVMEETTPDEPKKKMTIAERASLTRRLEEEEADETEE